MTRHQSGHAQQKQQNQTQSQTQGRKGSTRLAKSVRRTSLRHVRRFGTTKLPKIATGRKKF